MTCLPTGRGLRQAEQGVQTELRDDGGTDDDQRAAFPSGQPPRRPARRAEGRGEGPPGQGRRGHQRVPQGRCRHADGREDRGACGACGGPGGHAGHRATRFKSPGRVGRRAGGGRAAASARCRAPAHVTTCTGVRQVTAPRSPTESRQAPESRQGRGRPQLPPQGPRRDHVFVPVPVLAPVLRSVPARRITVSGVEQRDKRLPGPGDSGADRAHRTTDDGGRLRIWQSDQLGEHERLPPGRCQGGKQIGQGHPLVEPRTALTLYLLRHDLPVGEPGDPRPRLVRTDPVGDRAPGDGQQPGTGRGPAFESGQAAQGTQVGVLHQVVRGLGITAQMRHVAQHMTPGAPHELLDGLLVARSGCQRPPGHQRVLGLTHARPPLAGHRAAR